MKAFKVREVLAKLSDADAAFSTINAVLQKTKTLIVGSEQVEGALSQETTKGYRVHQLEVERLKAKAEELAQRLRQRLI